MTTIPRRLGLKQVLILRALALVAGQSLNHSFTNEAHSVRGYATLPRGFWDIRMGCSDAVP